LELVSLVGSVGLLVAAYVSLFKPSAAARLALLACLAIWCFYGPAIAKSVHTKFDKQSSVLPDRLLFTARQFWGQRATTTFSVDPETELVLAGSFAPLKGPWA
jgi:hypothetical protein